MPELLPLRVRGRSMVPTLRPDDEVLIESVSAEALVNGDWVVVRSVEGGFLHRYLGMRDDCVLTKGDGHAGFDPLWPPEAVVGRVAEARRGGRCFYRRTAGQVRRERLLAAGHHLVGSVWGLARRLKALLLALFALVLGVSLVAAAVGLTDFYAEDETDRITLKWETASETNNLGFYMRRSLTETAGYENILCDDARNPFIASQDEGAGAAYECEDVHVLPGVVYYYQLQDVPDNGTNGDFYGPITASIPLATVTPTPGAPTPTPGTPTMTLTPTPVPVATSTHVPPPGDANVRFWADEVDLSAGDCTTIQWQTDNIKAVFLDGNGVLGDGAVTLCPCKTETHVLSVTYSDDTTKDFEVTLLVTGECTTVTRTATPIATLEVAASPTPTPSASRLVATERKRSWAPRVRSIVGRVSCSSSAKPASTIRTPT